MRRPDSSLIYFAPLGLSPFNALVISGLVPTGFPPYREPYCLITMRIFPSRVAGSIAGGASAEPSTNGVTGARGWFAAADGLGTAGAGLAVAGAPGLGFEEE